MNRKKLNDRVWVMEEDIASRKKDEWTEKVTKEMKKPEQAI
jgi:hypothetical protein